MQATVVKNAGSHYLLAHLPEWDPFEAVLRGRIRLGGSGITNPVAVGDKVEYSLDEANGKAVIDKVLPRSNYVIRRSTNLSRQAHIIAANVDMAYLIVSMCFPEVKLPFLDRLLVTCEVYGIPVTIVLSKVDMYRDFAADQIEAFRRIYEGAGYKVVETSIVTGEGVEEIRGSCKGRVNLFSGESGVGKSSLIKALDPSLDPKTGEISEAHLQGKHTTSLYEMYPLRTGGFVIDSPGLRGFGLVDLEKEEIAKYFPEMLKASHDCRFTPCTHTHEPGCAVKAAVDAGTISPERYNSYLGMLEEDRKFR
ncbi:MAG: ribosome small subunit-dependent GTPase A [Bacteroidales bacterium]|nr:ribosome small subunit-dependent GTPase A [Bacteroidales bacterium]